MRSNTDSVVYSDVRGPQKYWTEEENEVLIREWEQGTSWSDIAEILERTPVSVISHARQMGIGRKVNYVECPDTFTDRERQIVYGTLLGDASIHSSSTSESYYLEMYHKYDHLSYLEWFKSELKRFCPKIYTWTVYSQSHKRMVTKCNLRTSARTPLWKMLHDEIYQDERTKQHIPVEQLTPLALAVLWQDDGTYNKGYGVLSCQNFASDEVMKLGCYLDDQYGIDNTILQNNTIGIRGDGMVTLADIIRPHILPLFRYKIGDVRLPIVKQCATFEFDAAHFLEDYCGGCINMHGHRYKIEVILSTTINPDTGMGWDYRDIKKAVNPVIEEFDHNMLNDVDPSLKWRSTTELISVLIWNKLVDLLPLYEIKIYETPSTWCSYRGGR